MADGEDGSIIGALFWMVFLSLLLFWAPVVGPLLAGFVGGMKAGGIGSAIVAVFLPALLLGAAMFFFGSVLTGLPIVGAIFAAGGFFLVITNVGLLLLGAIVGGAFA